MIEFFSITPEIDGWMFLFFTVLACFTAAFGVVAGLGGGVLLLAFMTTVFPPTILIPLHGAVLLGTNVGRAILMFKHIRKDLLPAFSIGALLGAIFGVGIIHFQM